VGAVLRDGDAGDRQPATNEIYENRLIECRCGRVVAKKTADAMTNCSATRP
jgi:hypothetical protein